MAMLTEAVTYNRGGFRIGVKRLKISSDGEMGVSLGLSHGDDESTSISVCLSTIDAETVARALLDAGRGGSDL